MNLEPKRTEKILDQEPLSLTLWDLKARNEEIHLQSWCSDTKLQLENFQENGVIDTVESSREVQQQQSCREARVKGHDNVVVHFDDCCFRGVMSTKARLRGWKQMY